MTQSCAHAPRPDPKTAQAPARVAHQDPCCAHEGDTLAGLPRFLDAVQPKLTVGARDDPLEHEADTVAEAVLRQEPVTPRFLDAGPKPPVQRLCDDCAEDLAEAAGLPDEAPVQRDATTVPHETRAAPQASQSADRTAGLSPVVRGRLENSLGIPLGDVRVHTGPGPQTLAGSLGARAFTHGRDIWLGPRQTPDDIGLMAHEVAHVLQQSSGRAEPERLQRAPADYRHPEDGGNVAARMQSKIDEAVDDSEEGDESGGDSAASAHEARRALSQIDRGELASERGELQPEARPDVDRPAAEQPRVQQAESATKTEADSPAEPLAEGEAEAEPEAAGAAKQKGGAVTDGAAAAFAAAGSMVPPSPEPVVVPAPAVQPVDAGGQALPGNPSADAAVGGLGQAAQQLREQGTRVRAFAAEQRANAHRMRGNLALVRTGVAQSELGVATSNDHLAFRQGVAGQAREGLSVSEQKAATVAAEAPGFSSKADEGKAESGPMASEAGSLAAENAANTPSDPEAAANAREQGGQMNQAGSDIATTDDAVSQTQTKATTLASDAATAQQTNTGTRAELDGIDATLAATGEKLTTMGTQNTAARAQLSALESAPGLHTQQANALDEQGSSLVARSYAIEQRLQAIQSGYDQGMRAVPALPESEEFAEESAEAPAESATAAASIGSEGIIQREPDPAATPAVPDGAALATSPAEAASPVGDQGLAATDETEEGLIAESQEPAPAIPPQPPEDTAPEPPPAVGDDVLPESTPPVADILPGRERVDIGGAAAEALPSWLTGVPTPTERAREEAAAAAEERRQSQIAEIETEAGGDFESLSATDKMGIALRMTGNNLFGSIGNIQWPGFGHLALGLIDPRGPLMGVVSGLSMMLTGGANLLSAEQWSRDPLGNLLKSAADIATGLTVILGSITALAGVIIAIMTAITILSFGTAAPITGPVIAFCTTVLTTVGGWTIAVGKVALVLQALVLIKNLIDAACAETAAELQSEATQMTENVSDAGNVLMQMGMAKAGQLGGRAAASEIQAAGGGVRYAAQMGARAGVTARSGLAATGRGLRAAPGAALRGARALPGAAVRGARALPGAIGRGVGAVGRGGLSAARAIGRGVAQGGRAVGGRLAAGARSLRGLPGRAAAGLRALPGRAAAGLRAMPGRVVAGVRGLPGRLRESVGSGMSRGFLVGDDIANLGMARSASAEARAAVWAEARAPGGALAGEARVAGTADDLVDSPTAMPAEEGLPTGASDTAGRIDEAGAGAAAEREVSVGRSSHLESDQITPREAANEVTHVSDHPELIEGSPPTRRARIGEHEIVEQRAPELPTGIGCARHSNGGLRVPCPRGMGSAAGTRPALTAAQERLLNRFLARLERQGLTRDEALRLLGLSSDDELRALAAGARSEQELQALLSARAEASGAAARAEARAAARGTEPLPDEGFDEASRVLTPDDLRELGQSTRPLPLAVERQLLQEAVDDVAVRLLADPHEAARLLSPAELAAVHEHPQLTAMYFGNAVERGVAQRLTEVPALERFLHTPQRPRVSTPDIGGPIGPTGPRAYDITTSSPRAIAAHEARSYAPFTEWVTYPPLPPTYRFPPPSEVLPTALPTARRAEAGVPAIRPGTAMQLAHRHGRGAPLDPALRQDLAPRFGADLSAVRIHHDGDADTLSRDLGARAFTLGQEIFFRTGLFAPHTAQGRQLLAHEITHTLQQSSGACGVRQNHDGLHLGDTADDQEREAESLAEAIDADPHSPELSVAQAADAGLIQRQAAPNSAPPQSSAPGGDAPTAAADAARLKPPAWTDYFDEVVPAVLEAAEAHDEVGLKRAMWLIVQSYGEQSPGVSGRPSTHRNRLFNEQAAVIHEPGTNKITGVVPGQEKTGIYLYNLKQNESRTRDKTEMRSSPTFGYDTPERAAHHHLEEMQARWGSAWRALTVPGGSFAGFAQGLKSAGYARANDYDTVLIQLENQVRREVRQWVAFRLPEMRKRIPKMEAYSEFLRAEQATWLRLAAMNDPTGSNRHQAQWIGMLIIESEAELVQLRARTARLERFAGELKVKT